MTDAPKVSLVVQDLPLPHDALVARCSPRTTRIGRSCHRLLSCRYLFCVGCCYTEFWMCTSSSSPSTCGSTSGETLGLCRWQHDSNALWRELAAHSPTSRQNRRVSYNAAATPGRQILQSFWKVAPLKVHVPGRPPRTPAAWCPTCLG